MTYRWTEDESSQIKAVLAAENAGCEWARGKLRSGQSFDDLTYSDIFSVTPEDVHDYVDQAGWDPRVVKEVDQRPPTSEASASYYLFPRAGRWVYASPGDRGEWIEVTFPDRQSARRDLAKTLLYIQWSDWNNEHRWKRGWTGDLADLYPPPPQ